MGRVAVTFGPEGAVEGLPNAEHVPDDVPARNIIHYESIPDRVPSLDERIAALVDVRGVVESASNTNELRSAVLALLDTLTGEA